ncbi:methionine ABC transporter ATP-binding protein [Agromyces archimandritae]|uniref:methionine ABC transporter ATP-binding protein n=1 Tax=Agromyces archimandritae TaxID=2781962 RepID=UPI001FD089E5|nr:ATP-binding cassette domain-containing protein [Agromyces archimandritae]
MIEVQNLTKVFGEPPNRVRALDDVSLRVEPGEILAVVGASGSGKSTLVRCLTLLEQPTSGTVIVGGNAITELDERRLREARRAIGQVFQHANLLDNRTAKRNVEYPLEVAGWGKKEREARASELLALVGLADRQHTYPSQLSGGQQQRVGIARALASNPEVLLCDEPTSALDPTTTRGLLDLLARLRDELGVTILIITHDLGVVRRIADRVAVLDSGRITDIGRVDEVATRLSSTLLSDLSADGELGETELRVIGGSGQASIPFISRLTAELGVEVRLISGGSHAIGEHHVVKADLGFGTREERDRAGAWLQENEFTVVTAA